MSNKKKEFFLVRWLKRCFLGDRSEISLEDEEKIQTPMRAMVQSFVHKPLAMLGLIVFLAIFVFVIVGPHYWPLDLSDQDASLTNLPPSNDMMSVPKELLETGIADIASGNTYGIGTDVNGKLYMWGHTRVTDKIDMADIPQEVLDADLTYIAAGTDHCVAVGEDGQVYVWGNTRLQQDKFSSDMTKAMKKGGDAWNVIQLEASNQFSAIVTSDGNLYLWGNGNMADIKLRSKYEGKIAKVALTENEYIALLTDGTVAYTGYKDKNSPFAKIPAELKGKTVVDIASTSKSVAAITEDGRIVVWGNATKGEADVPELSSKPVHLYGGRYHYTALLENGDVVSWGNNKYHQIDVPDAVNSADNIERIFVSNYQNYALGSDGKLYTWGLKGFTLGTDSLGRDMLTRIVNGGRVTMTVGAISVVIATILGVLFGGLAGYFGGHLDIIIMRIAEIVGGLPFIPFAMILSAVIGTRLDPTQRMYLIMVVLGVLSWVPTCRLVRAQILAQREMEYVTAAKAMGIREGTIVFRHILPNVVSLLIVSMTLDFATCMLTESTLSYLGFGIPLPTPTWGNLLNGANNSIVIQQYWWQWVFPALIFGICTICINLIGDGLRDALDPKALER
ncbi:MAG: ABC transporter permease subunit [Clostridiales bacterium]|nr:ABC transporter permease subunit [Clostridiales bacterium]MDY5515632.1 ABC transporter permease subunit [Candidatus Ventricola sp.]